jgi:hypothetical protein
MAEFEQNYQWDEEDFNNELNFNMSFPKEFFDNRIPIAEEPAIFYPDGSGATRTEIRRKRLIEDITEPLQMTPALAERTFEEWQPILEQRQQEYKELCSLPETVKIQIPTKRPILLTPIGDIHAEHPETNLKQLGRDIDMTKSVGGYFLTLGDLTDSVHFRPEPKAVSNQEATAYMRSALKYMAEDGHLLAGWMGDHEGWAYDQHNAHTLYDDFWKRYNAHLLDGVSYMDIGLTNGESQHKYAIIGSHRHKGFSVYNDAHASWRQQLDEANTSRDIISLTAHNHTKAYLQQTRKVFGGDERRIHAVSLGTYKETDRYSRKHGWPRKGEETAKAFGIVLHPEQDKAQVFWTVEDAVDYIARR